MANLLDAQRARTELNRVLTRLFEHYDLLLTPTVPNEAFAAACPRRTILKDSQCLC